MEKLQSTIDPHIDIEELRRLERQVASLGESLERLQDEMAKQSKLLAEMSQRVMESRPETTAPVTRPAAEGKSVTPDVLLIIAAAVSAFLGKKIRIRSARMLQSPYEIVNPWSQQGRVSVQASHSLRWER